MTEHKEPRSAGAPPFPADARARPQPHGHGHGHGHEQHDAPLERRRPDAPPTHGFVAATIPGRPVEPLKPGEGKNKTLFLDAQSGIAGDMTLAALLDLGVPLAIIQEAIACLNVGPVELVVREGYAESIGCLHVSVEFPPQAAERSFSEISDLIERSALDESTRTLSLRIFRRLAEAEAEVHRTTLDQVHFHEVGAVDAIVDIVGVARAVTYLGACVKATPLPLSSGFVHCRHGTLPLPAPATLLCLRGVPTRASGLAVELVTPTGAAIVSTLAAEYAPWLSLTPDRVGWGAGTRGLPDRPNALRIILGRENSVPNLGKEDPTLQHSTLALLEANVDDMTGELAGEALARVMEKGALDVWIAPVIMKKGRPGLVFSALVVPERAHELSLALLEETSSLGVRQTLVSRLALPREVFEFRTPWGLVRVKRSSLPDGRVRTKPEFADVARIARERAEPMAQVLAEIQSLLLEDPRSAG